MDYNAVETERRQRLFDEHGAVLISDVVMLRWSSSKLRRVMRELMIGWPRTSAQLAAAIYYDDPDGGPLTASNVIRTYILRLRRQLKPGWVIATHGHRYQLELA